MSERWFTCEDCGSERLAPSSTGRLPRFCDPCRPDRAEDRERKTRRRDREQQLAKRVEELEHALAENQVLDPRRTLRYGEPGRAALGRAIRAVAHAEGAHGTAEALRDLAAIATAWAGALGVRHEPEPIVEAA